MRNYVPDYDYVNDAVSLHHYYKNDEGKIFADIGMSDIPITVLQKIVRQYERQKQDVYNALMDKGMSSLNIEYLNENEPDKMNNIITLYAHQLEVLGVDSDVYGSLEQILNSSEGEFYKVNVLTCAAPNLRLMPTNRWNEADGKKPIKLPDTELLAIHEKKMRRILDVSMKEGNEVLILGAFGCGAYQNNPEVVARALKTAVKDYLHAFKTIEFAVYVRPGDDSNFRIFERNMKGI